MFIGANRYIYLILCALVFLGPAPSQAASLIERLSNSVRLRRIEKEKVHHNILLKLNEQVKQEVARGEITDVLDRIEKGGLEKKVLKGFFAIISTRKYHNDRLKKRLEQRTYKSDEQKKQAYNAFQTLMVDLIPDDVKELVYLYPVIMPFANFYQLASVKITDIDESLLTDERFFKFYFFYLYRKFADLDKTKKSYNSIYKKKDIAVDGGRKQLEKFFTRDVGFGFFNDKLDSGISNKQSKFFNFDGYLYKYLKNEHQDDQGQNILIRIFKTFCVYKSHCKDCDMLEFYNRRKLGIFKHPTREMERYSEYVPAAFTRYVKPLYYLCRTFPNISPFTLTHGEKYKFTAWGEKPPEDDDKKDRDSSWKEEAPVVHDEKYKFTAWQEKSPVLEKLMGVWKKIEAKEKDPDRAVKMLQYTLGSIYLLPQKDISLTDEDYSFDRSGYATYMQEYIEIYNKYHPPAQ